jgi:hypothetical protein
MFRTLLATTALIACALPAHAQTAYTSTRDTLRFRETTQLHVTLTMPQGEIPMTVEQRATLSLVRLPGDSARAWFDSLAISATGPQGELKPETDSALKRTFRLGLDSTRARDERARAAVAGQPSECDRPVAPVR